MIILGSMIRLSDVVVLVKKLGEEERLELQALWAHQTCIDFVGTIRKEELSSEFTIFGQSQAESQSASVAV
jgi:hypothetical protein